MGGWVGGVGGGVLSENNATLSEDWIGFSDRSSVAIMTLPCLTQQVCWVATILKFFGLMVVVNLQQ